jgi:hypothetical protein
MAGYVVGEKAIEGGTFVVVSVAALEGCPLLAQYAAVSPYVFCRLRQTVPVRAILGNSKCDVLVELWRSADVRRQGQNVFVGDVSISIKCGEIISVFDESLYLLQLRQGGDDDEMEMLLEEDTWVQLTSGLDDGGDVELDIGNEEDAIMGEDAEDDAQRPKAYQSRRKRRPSKKGAAWVGIFGWSSKINIGLGGTGNTAPPLFSLSHTQTHTHPYSPVLYFVTYFGARFVFCNVLFWDPPRGPPATSTTTHSVHSLTHSLQHMHSCWNITTHTHARTIAGFASGPRT